MRIRIVTARMAIRSRGVGREMVRIRIIAAGMAIILTEIGRDREAARIITAHMIITLTGTDRVTVIRILTGKAVALTARTSLRLKRIIPV